MKALALYGNAPTLGSILTFAIPLAGGQRAGGKPDGGKPHGGGLAGRKDQQQHQPDPPALWAGAEIF